MAKRVTTRREVLRFLESVEQTQTWLAGELGIAPSTLNDIMKGRRQPSLPLAVRLSEMTGVPVERFVTR
jgi:plasmid maintenance system antidote protein VapI